MNESTGPGPGRRQRARWVRPKEHDTYARGAKPAQGVVCSECGAVHEAGRWTWHAPPVAELRAGLCPACERIRDRYPAGTIRLPLAMASDREEIVNAVRALERAEKAEHPLERVMDIEETGEDLVITTTGVHLARRIAARLGRRLHVKPRLRYPAEQNLVFVEWPAPADRT